MIRINQEILHDLSAIIRGDLRDPRISPMTTVVAVDTTPDLKYCKVAVSVYGDDKEKADTLEGLKNSAGHIRSELAHRGNLRNTPKLSFVLDDSIEYAQKISSLIDSVVEKDED